MKKGKEGGQRRECVGKGEGREKGRKEEEEKLGVEGKRKEGRKKTGKEKGEGGEGGKN